MYISRQTDFDTKNGVCLEEREQADAIKSNLDKILHYERYRTENKSVDTVAPSHSVMQSDDRYFANSVADNVNYAKQVAPAPVIREESEDFRPTSTTMQFESSEDNDIFEEVGRRQLQKVEENFSISGKGKLLIAVYALVVALIMSLIVINSRMLRSLDSSITAYGAKIDALNAEYSRISEELNVANGEDAVGEWAIEHGYQKAA